MILNRHCVRYKFINGVSNVFQKLQSEIEMLESSLETAHATIKALQSQFPEGTNDDTLIQQVLTQL